MMNHKVQTETRLGSQPTQQRRPRALRLVTGLTLAAVLLAGLTGLFPSGLAAAQSAPPVTITVVSQTVLLQAPNRTVTVPIRLDASTDRKVSSAVFSLDYDSACLQYTNASFAGISGDFERWSANNVADTDGELDIAIWDNDSPVAFLAEPTVVVTVTFELLALCQKDGFTSIAFSTSPRPSLGDPKGKKVPNTPVAGTVTVDWNRTATAITLTPSTIHENKPVSTTVGILTNNDPDTDDAFLYSLVSGLGDTDNSLFTIVNGTLKANQPFNFEAKTSYSVRVQVADNKGPVFAQQLTITVVDVNEPPTAITLSTTDVVEDHPAGGTVATVAVTDPEPYDNTFTMTLSGPDAGYFVVDVLTVKVGAAALLNAEIKDSYTFTITVTDSAGNPYSQAVTFHVVNHSELRIPTSIALPPLWVQETNQVRVPVSYTAKANAPTVINFQLNYEQGCLAYVGYADAIGADNAVAPQSGPLRCRSRAVLPLPTADC